MTKLYDKNELGFSLIWIAIYVFGTSVCNNISMLVVPKGFITMIFHIALSTVLFFWIKKKGLMKKYGLCKAEQKPSTMLYYLPLAVICTCNFWFGVALNFTIAETVFNVVSMLFVGFLEEAIFRGFLFKAMARDNLKFAIVISSITFGIGHIINLFNGSGAELFSNLCQVIYATAFGFMTVMIFVKAKTLIPCIVTHSVVNALSVFADEANTSVITDVIGATALTVIAGGYALYLWRIKKRPNGTSNN